MPPQDADDRSQATARTAEAAAGPAGEARDPAFVASMAHDVNNMLAVVIGSIDQAGLQLPPTHPAFPDLSVARDAARRAAGMTKRLMQPGGRPVLTAVDVNAVVVGALRGLCRTLGDRILLVQDLAPDLWPAHADAEEICQMLFNLACNGRDAMPQGGSLRIRTRNTTLTGHCTMATRTLVAGDYVAIEVDDTGAGMSPGVQQRMFEPHFSTRATAGRGLGMSAVARAVHDCRGGVRVRSEPGRGTTVEVLLPRART